MGVVAGGQTGVAQTTRHVDDAACPGVGTGTLADPFCSIQAAIDVASNGDTVLVQDGRYNEVINFVGKAIAVRSLNGAASTIIDATGLNLPVVQIKSGEGRDSGLIGFTITGGLAIGVGSHGVGGAGIQVFNSSPTVLNCSFVNNETRIIHIAGSAHGGAIYCGSGAPLFANCIVRDNVVDGSGWGAWGSGIYMGASCAATVTDCTFTRNRGGPWDHPSTVFGVSATLTNSIVWGNSQPPGALGQIEGTLVVTYSDVEGGWTGPGGAGNVVVDPKFADPDGRDNVAGNLDDDLRIGPDSPCIDAGANAAVPPDLFDLDHDANAAEPIPWDLAGKARFTDVSGTPDTGAGVAPIVDLGAYEYQPSIPAASSLGVGLFGVGVLGIGGALLARRRKPGASASDRVRHSLAIVAGGALGCASSALAQVRVGPQVRIDNAPPGKAVNQGER